jgi:hypothetical protein
MRIKVNELANVVTGEDATGYRSAGRQPRPQITVPHLRLRLSIDEAESLALALLEAVAVAKRQATDSKTGEAR